MRFECNQKDIMLAITYGLKFIPAKPSHPILSNFKLIAKNVTLTLIGFDLSNRIEVEFIGVIQKEGEICLPAKLLNNIISKQDNESIISFDIQDEKCTITSLDSHYEIVTQSADEYPELIQSDDGLNEIEFDASVFLKGTKYTSFCVSTDDTKQALTGININKSDDKLIFAGIDGHKLAVSKFGLESENNLEESITIPIKAMRELEKIIDNCKCDTIIMQLSDGGCIFIVNGNDVYYKLYCRVIDAKYPNYQQLIPTEFQIQFFVNRKKLIKSVEKISVLLDSKNNLICLSLNSDNQLLQLEVNVDSVGKATEKIPVEYSGNIEIQTAFNCAYLLEILRNFSDCDEVQFNLNESTSPVVITPLENIDSLCLLMPVQLRK